MEVTTHFNENSDAFIIQKQGSTQKYSISSRKPRLPRSGIIIIVFGLNDHDKTRYG